MNKQFLKIVNLLVTTARFKGYKHPGGIRYPGGIVYYPRNPDHKDPEYTPTKLFRVQRVKSTRHFPYWQKEILENLNITNEGNIAIVKNIPEVNAQLWKVKHLIKITPITFPHGEPTREDINYTVLKENGECIVVKKLQPDQKQIEALDQFDKDSKKMDSTTLKKDSRYKWNHAYSGGF